VVVAEATLGNKDYRRRPGFFAEALGLITASWAYLRARFELATLEGKEAVTQYLKALGLLLGGVVVLFFGYLLFLLAIIFAIATAMGGGWAWVWVTLGAALLHFGGTAFLLLKCKGLVQGPVFPTTIAEFKKDQEWLETKNAKSS
jgi:uncharacterized membrane protein YqjE